ncbi:MAG: hypothetical protein NT074_00840 [Methanomicrobiales archaeon]|nr:hypothetical protein [Methanomicrobiales archaeon]
MKWKALPFHPFLFGLFPLLATYQQYAAMASPSDLLVPVAAVVFLVSGALAVAWRMQWDLPRSALGLTIVLVIIFLPGYLQDILLYTGSEHLLPATYLGVVIVLAILLGFFLLRFRGDLGNATKVLNFLGIVLVGLTLIGIAAVPSPGGPVDTGSIEKTLSQAISNANDPVSSPDIYYLILDGYTSSRVLSADYDFNNSDFESFLTAKGFLIANQSAANYYKTLLSLPSSLNMQYFGERTDSHYLTDPVVEAGLIRSVRQNAVVRFLKSRGYKIISARSDFFLTNQIDDSDLVLNPDVPTMYARHLPDRVNPLIVLNPVTLPVDVAWRRNFTQDIFARLEDVPEMPGKKFVFAHILIPHPPFIFGPNGEEITNRNKISVVKGYRDQVIYTNKRVRQLISTILKKSRNPAVIIIQGDHGPRLRYISEHNMDESLLILNAYRLPGPGQSMIHANISPVNSFRTIFNRYFGTDLPLLPDISNFNSVPYFYANYTFIATPDTSTGAPYYFAGGWEEPDVAIKDKVLRAKGWDDAEVSERSRLRWVTGNGTIIIPSSTVKNATLSFVAMSDAIPRTLDITVNGVQTGVMAVGTTATPGSFPVSLKSGDNTVVFSSLEGCTGTGSGNVPKRSEWCFTVGIGDIKIG